MAQLKKILVATDLGETSDAAFRMAVDLGRRLGCEVVVLHAVEPCRPMLPDVDAAFYAKLDAHLLDERRARLDAAIASLGAEVRPRTVVRAGNPVDVVPEVATEIGADLLVIGTHHYRRLERFFMGSVAEQLLRVAPCAVLTVPSAPTPT